MTQAVNKKDSIYFQLLRLLVFSAIAAGLVFWVMNYSMEYVINCYYDHTGYERQQDENYIRKLQQYIERNQLTSRDAESLDSWVKKQRILTIRIYKDGIQVFDSEYPQQELWEEEIAAGDYEWENYYSVKFVDGEAQVYIWGLYAYQFYNYALIIEIMFSFILFLILVLLGIRRKMNYILKLSEEIELLEGGSLDYKITVKGKDELTALAEGLDNMRLSFRSLIKREADIVRENQKVITEMSHDIRTPVTSIMLYTEIIKTGKYKDEVHLKEYIEKIDKKAHRMKQLTEHLYEYTLVTGTTEMVLEEPEYYEVLFYDLFSETCSYLRQKGFTIEFSMEWVDKKLRICTDYIWRIIDNISSNIIKYADPQKAVEICSVCNGNKIGFSFRNAVKQLEETVESTHVGIPSVKNMMEKMNGICEVRQDKEYFYIAIIFPEAASYSEEDHKRNVTKEYMESK